MKTPITYYGGKQVLAPFILTLIPQHKIYVEPFFGGGAVFFAKGPSEVEIINDTNNEVINFYKVLQSDFEGLQNLVNATLYSRDAHRQACVIYSNPDMFTCLQRAWAFWNLSLQCFGSSIGGSWIADKKHSKRSVNFSNKKRSFKEELSTRIENACIENTDAIYIIKGKDSPDTFHYIDPPYFNANMGHYDGYTEADFENLLRTLSEVKGKFLLSSYPSELLEKYSQLNGWYTIKKEMPLSNSSKKERKKVEVFTANYPIVQS